MAVRVLKFQRKGRPDVTVIIIWLNKLAGLKFTDRLLPISRFHAISSCPQALRCSSPNCGA